MAVESPAAFNQNSTYSAAQTRRAVFFGLGSAGGVKGVGDLLVSAPSSGMSVNVATGEVIIPGSNTDQGSYYGLATSITNLVIAAANGTNPRIDMVCATVTDVSYGSATDSWTPQVVTGTPTSGATLSNLSGAPALPANSLLIAYVLVPAGATSIASGNLLDERVRVGLWAPQSGQLLGRTQYDPGTQTTYTLPNGVLAAVDNTNMAVSFVAPPSGAVIFGWNAGAHVSGGAAVGYIFGAVWDVGAAAVATGAPNQIMLADGYNGTSYTDQYGPVRYRALVASLTAGKTYNWAPAAAYVSNASSLYVGGAPGNGAAFVEVSAA